MDLIFLVILAFIGITGLFKGQIKISKKKALKGTKARILSGIFILSGIQLIIKDYYLAPTSADGGSGYLLGTAAVVAVAAILFMIFGQENIGPTA